MEYVYAVPAHMLPAAQPQIVPLNDQLYQLLNTAGQYLPRPEAEEDPTWRQVIPYVLLEHRGKVLLMRRIAGGDARLRLRYSLGVGGHINPIDQAAPEETDRIAAALRREMQEEVHAEIVGLQPLGLIILEDSPVSRVHVGVLYWAQSATVPSIRETDKLEGTLATLAEITAVAEHLEGWSQLALQLLPQQLQLSTAVELVSEVC